MVRRTRQQRISERIQIAAIVKASVGKILQVVLTDERTIIGTVTATSSDTLVLSNMRQKKMTVPLSRISEIYIDTVD